MLLYWEILARWCEKWYSAWCRKCYLEKGCYFDLVKSSRLQLLHEESQLKKWRVMEMKRIIWSDKRLYTIGNISEELIFSFFIDCIYIIFYKRVVTALYSFLFNKHVIFYYIFLKQNFSFSLKVSVYKLLTNFICVLLLFAWMVFMLLISSSQIMVDQAV